ncbi:hypothetical protein PG984_003013 [Apiospora sp. TS-2023a]
MTGATLILGLQLALHERLDTGRDVVVDDLGSPLAYLRRGQVVWVVGGGGVAAEEAGQDGRVGFDDLAALVGGGEDVDLGGHHVEGEVVPLTDDGGDALVDLDVVVALVGREKSHAPGAVVASGVVEGGVVRHAVAPGLAGAEVEVVLEAALLDHVGRAGRCGHDGLRGRGIYGLGDGGIDRLGHVSGTGHAEIGRDEDGLKLRHSDGDGARQGGLDGGIRGGPVGSSGRGRGRGGLGGASSSGVCACSSMGRRSGVHSLRVRNTRRFEVGLGAGFLVHSLGARYGGGANVVHGRGLDDAEDCGHDSIDESHDMGLDLTHVDGRNHRRDICRVGDHCHKGCGWSGDGGGCLGGPDSGGGGGNSLIDRRDCCIHVVDNGGFDGLSGGVRSSFVHRFSSRGPDYVSRSVRLRAGERKSGELGDGVGDGVGDDHNLGVGREGGIKQGNGARELGSASLGDCHNGRRYVGRDRGVQAGDGAKDGVGEEIRHEAGDGSNLRVEDVSRRQRVLGHGLEDGDGHGPASDGGEVRAHSFGGRVSLTVSVVETVTAGKADVWVTVVTAWETPRRAEQKSPASGRFFRISVMALVSVEAAGSLETVLVVAVALVSVDVAASVEVAVSVDVAVPVAVAVSVEIDTVLVSVEVVVSVDVAVPVEVAVSVETVLAVAAVLVSVEVAVSVETVLASVDVAVSVEVSPVTVVLVPVEVARSVEAVLPSVEVAASLETVLAVTEVLICIKVAESLETLLVPVEYARPLETVRLLALHDLPDDFRFWCEGNASAALAASESRRSPRIFGKE